MPITAPNVTFAADSAEEVMGHYMLGDVVALECVHENQMLPALVPHSSACLGNNKWSSQIQNISCIAKTSGFMFTTFFKFVLRIQVAHL